MKRTKFIMLALVVALVLMGAGYAAWTQVFTINSTVSTGELSVSVAETHVVEVLNADGITYSPATSTNSPDLNLGVTLSPPANNSSSLTYTFSKIYPGTRLTSTITFTNDGSMETKTAYNDALGSITNYGNQLCTDLEIKVDGAVVSHGLSADEMKHNIANAIATAIGNIPVGEHKDIIITQELPIGSTNGTENLTMGWVASLSFEQYNKQ